MDQHAMPRPSYYALRILGMWQPRNCHIVTRIYQNVIVFSFWIAAIFAIVGIVFINNDDKEIKYGQLISSVAYCINLTVPYAICRYYFTYGNYESLMRIAINDDQTTFKKIQKLSKCYSFISLLVWVLAFVLFFFQFRRFITINYQYPIFLTVLFFSTGWWACWLSIYGFICNVHKLQIKEYIIHMKNNYGYSPRTCSSEESCAADLLDKFTTLSETLQQSQKAMSKIISFSTAYYICNLILFSVAFFKVKYKRKISLWLYLGDVAFNVLSVLFKLYPAAIMNQSLHEIVLVSGEHCNPDLYMNVVSKERFVIYQYLFLREQDLGMEIMGIKITSKLTVGIFVTLTTFGLGFLHYVVPYLRDHFNMI